MTATLPHLNYRRTARARGAIGTDLVVDIFAGAVDRCANARTAGCVLRRSGCLVLQNRRCSTFEAVVVPALRAEGKVGALAHYAEGQRVASVTEALRSGRVCACGAPLPKRGRLCPACREKSRRESYRASRATVNGKTAVVNP